MRQTAVLGKMLRYGKPSVDKRQATAEDMRQETELQSYKIWICGCSADLISKFVAL